MKTDESELPDATCSPVPILDQRIGTAVSGFRERLRVVATATSVRNYARDANVSEGAVRQWIKGPSLPDLDKLLRLAAAGGVRFEWLGIGEGPRTQAEAEAARQIVQGQQQSQPAPPPINQEAFAAILAGIMKNPRGRSPESLAASAVEFYCLAIERGLITPTGIGEGSGTRAA